MRTAPWFGFLLAAAVSSAGPANALPPPDDTPEEILRTEVIVDARSPLDGQPLSPAEYAELEAALQESLYAPQLSNDTRNIIFLLQIRKLLTVFFPFI